MSAADRCAVAADDISSSNKPRSPRHARAAGSGSARRCCRRSAECRIRGRCLRPRRSGRPRASDWARSRRNRRGCAHRWRGGNSPGRPDRRSGPRCPDPSACWRRGSRCRRKDRSKTRYCRRRGRGSAPQRPTRPGPTRAPERRRSAFQRRQPLFENVGRRIADPRVDIAQFLQREEIGRVFGVAELVGGRLIDRRARPQPVAGSARQPAWRTMVSGCVGLIGHLASWEAVRASSCAAILFR